MPVHLDVGLASSARKGFVGGLARVDLAETTPEFVIFLSKLFVLFAQC